MQSIREEQIFCSKKYCQGIIRIIGTFDSAHKEIRRILEKYWDMLLEDDELKLVFGNVLQGSKH